MKRFPLLYAVIFTGYIGISMIVIIFTSMLFDPGQNYVNPSLSFNARSYLIGAIVSMYPFGQFLGLPIIGGLSDHYGRKKILCFSLFASSILYFLIGWGIQIAFFPLILLSLFILGFSEGNVVIAQSIISEQTVEQSQRLKRFGMIPILISLSFVIGPFLVAHFNFFSLDSHWNFSLPFHLIGLLIFVLFGVISLFFHYPKPLKKESTYSPKFALVSLFHHPKLLIIYLANFFLFMAFAGLFRLYPIYLVDKFQLDTFALSKAIALNGLGIIFANTIVAPLMKKFPTETVLKIFTLLAGGFIFSITLQKELPTTIFLTVLSATCLGTCTIFALDQISRAAPQETLGEILGNNSSLNTLSQVLIGFIGSYVLTINQKGPMVISAIFALLASSVFIKISNRSSSQR
jgi:DHA1 family tetracycline resistance protein-like MFS transporter